MKYKFPKQFLFGTASASYQIEGGFDAEGKGESIWDRFTHQPGNIVDHTNADMACDFYHRYREDIDLAQQFGMQVYRLSISWPRIYPQGTGEVCQQGLNFYKKVLTYIKEKGMQTSVTLYHWDLPQKLQDRGGFANREIVDWFETYARTLYRELGQLVDSWITLNEPYCTAILGNWTGEHAPGCRDYSLALLVVHNLMRCHGAAVKAFRESGLSAKIGITLNVNKAMPITDSPEDKQAAIRATQEATELFCDPVFKGSYPKELFAYLEKKGVVLPEVTKEDSILMKQELDFLGINFYQTNYVKAKEHWPLDFESVKTGRPLTDADWQVTPEGIYDTIDYVYQTYKPKEIIVTENGAACNDWIGADGHVKDTNRTEFLKQYLAEIHRAITDQIPISGYYVWCFCDNFEWAWGLKRRFGMVYVDYETQKRTPKDSLYFYRDLIQSRCFELETERKQIL